MVFSGRELVKFVIFVVLIGAVVFYVASNREHLIENLSISRTGQGPSSGPGQSSARGSSAEQGQLDLSDAEVIPVAALSTAGSPALGTPDGSTPASSPALQGTSPSGSPSSGSGVSTGSSADGGQDLFVEFRLEREQARSLQLDLLREVLNNANLGDNAHERALQAWLAITQDIAREVDIENLIRAKGFADAVVVLRDGKATVMVKAASLTQEEVFRIADIAVRLAGLSYEDVTVMARGG